MTNVSYCWHLIFNSLDLMTKMKHGYIVMSVLVYLIYLRRAARLMVQRPCIISLIKSSLKFKTDLSHLDDIYQRQKISHWRCKGYRQQLKLIDDNWHINNLICTLNISGAQLLPRLNLDIISALLQNRFATHNFATKKFWWFQPHFYCTCKYIMKLI